MPNDTGPSSEKAEYHQANFIQYIEGRLNYETHVILVVDDQESVRHWIVREIQHAAPGILTMEAADGEEALAKLADIRDTFQVDPLLLVVDLEMPGMDGWTLLDRLRADYLEEDREQGIPVIVLSSTPGERRRGLFKESIHGNKSTYIPLVSVAKNDCVDPERFDAVGKQGLTAWVRHFVDKS